MTPLTQGCRLLLRVATSSYGQLYEYRGKGDRNSKLRLANRTTSEQRRPRRVVVLYSRADHGSRITDHGLGLIRSVPLLRVHSMTDVSTSSRVDCRLEIIRLFKNQLLSFEKSRLYIRVRSATCNFSTLEYDE